jgi:[NiFe] hydrogenase assembly HybE family chaperone
MADCDALVRAFRRIDATRMADMPLRNPALDIEAVGFREWAGRQVGVLITPWSVSVIVLPGSAKDVSTLLLDQRQRWCFPSGEYEFMGGAEPECGAYQFCSLFSPPQEIADQAQARAVAQAVMQQLFQTPGVSRRALFSAVKHAESAVESTACTR